MNVSHLLRSSLFRAMSPLACGWRDFSRLVLVGDAGGWVLDEEIRDLRNACNRLGLRTMISDWDLVARNQCVFYASKYILLNPPRDRGHRACLAYFHGRPGSGLKEFDDVFENLRNNHERWARIQVSHSEMREVILSSRIAPEKVHVIPIGIRLGMFKMVTPESHAQVRAKLGIPSEAFVVGSFQKDGNGWGEGLEPKLIKGPDVLVKTLCALKDQIPNLFVLLSGPARGYVKRELTAARIPFCHVYTKTYEEIPILFHALDVVLVTSRQEGGPKAVLEAMASGVPLVTTRVGQAMDLVKNGENAFMVPVEDVDGLAYAVEQVLELDSVARNKLVSTGRAVAEANAWDRQDLLWKNFFDGVVK